MLHRGPQHPHPHSQQQQLQRDVSVHARPQGGADTSQQTRGLIELKTKPELRTPLRFSLVDEGEQEVGGESNPFHTGLDEKSSQRAIYAFNPSSNTNQAFSRSQLIKVVFPYTL